MTDQSNPDGGQPRQIKLNQVAKQFMSGLQRHFDLLAFNLAAQETVGEKTYDQRVNATRIMPFVSHHQNFEQLQAYARDLLVRQVVNDSLNLAITAMNNVHFFLSLIKVTGSGHPVDPNARKEAQASQESFIRAKLDEKFERLEKDHGVMCELEDSITAMGFILQILVKQGGVVKKEQLDKRGKLLLELKAVDPKEVDSVTNIPPEKVTTVSKVYHEDDVIFFEDTELQLFLITIAAFADSLFKSVFEYARSVKKNG